MGAITNGTLNIRGGLISRCKIGKAIVGIIGIVGIIIIVFMIGIFSIIIIVFIVIVAPTPTAVTNSTVIGRG
jgi:hypothetical protein